MKIIVNPKDGNWKIYVVGNYIIDGLKMYKNTEVEKIRKHFNDDKLSNELISYFNDSEDWEKLAVDKNDMVRVLVAIQGHALNILINDKEWYVRGNVVHWGYGLDVLINDETYEVRREVAHYGYGLDVLINDKEWIVRSKVAKKGYGLDVLMNDKHYMVRYAVALQGYGLDVLMNDKNDMVSRTARKMKLRKK